MRGVYGNSWAEVRRASPLQLPTSDTHNAAFTAITFTVKENSVVPEATLTTVLCL